MAGTLRIASHPHPIWYDSHHCQRTEKCTATATLTRSGYLCHEVVSQHSCTESALPHLCGGHHRPAWQSMFRLPLRSRADCAQWLLNVIDALGIAQARVIGLSFGGWLSLNFALAAPDRVTQLEHFFLSGWGLSSRSCSRCCFLSNHVSPAS